MKKPVTYPIRRTGRIGEPQEYVEYVRKDGTILLTQRSGPNWPVYLNNQGSFRVLDSGKTKVEGEALAKAYAEGSKVIPTVFPW